MAQPTAATRRSYAAPNVDGAVAARGARRPPIPFAQVQRLVAAAAAAAATATATTTTTTTTDVSSGSVVSVKAAPQNAGDDAVDETAASRSSPQVASSHDEPRTSSAVVQSDDNESSGADGIGGGDDDDEPKSNGVDVDSSDTSAQTSRSARRDSTPRDARPRARRQDPPRVASTRPGGDGSDVGDNDGGDRGGGAGGGEAKQLTRAERKRQRETGTTSFETEQRFFDLHPTVEGVAGWDEAGRGALFGAVVSVCCRVARGAPLVANVWDSKTYPDPPLTERAKRVRRAKQRKRYAPPPLPPGAATAAASVTTGARETKEEEEESEDDNEMEPEGDRERVCDQLMRAPGHTFRVAMREPDAIDRVNILRALYETMCEAILGCEPLPDVVLVDGDSIAPALVGHSRLHARTEIRGDARCYSIAAASVVAKVTRDRMVRRLALASPGYGLMQHKGYGVPAHMAALLRLGATKLHRMSFDPMKSCVRRGDDPFVGGTLVPVKKDRSRYRRSNGDASAD